jgi:hypothetical protein
VTMLIKLKNQNKVLTKQKKTCFQVITTECRFESLFFVENKKHHYKELREFKRKYLGINLKCNQPNHPQNETG